MKRKMIYLSIVIFFITQMNGYFVDTHDVKKTNPLSEQTQFVKRACWISYIDIQTYLSDKNEAVFRAKLNSMYRNICDNGLNTVIIHARAMGDSFYPSAYFPYSVYLSSAQTEPGYDAFQIMVETAHLWGLKVEAWVNPYRISISDEATQRFYDSKYYAQYKDMILEYAGSNGKCLSFDPGNEEARQLIINQIKEIVSNYDIDGVHLDDYFYVEGMQPQLSTDEKKQNVNILIRQLYQQIKEIKPNCEFGISPAGNLDYARSQGADIDTWLSENGYIDYIMPQIYWTDHYVIGDDIVEMFTMRCEAWQDINYNHIPMYVGLALYRVGEQSDVDLDWSKKNDNLVSQCKIAAMKGYMGFGLFRYAYMEEQAACEELYNLRQYLGKQQDKAAAPQNINAYIAYIPHMQTYGWTTAKTDGIVAGSTRDNKYMEALCIQLGSLAQEGSVCYRTYIQEQGWQPWVRDGTISGTTGQSKRIEALEIVLSGPCKETHDIYYRTYCVQSGWSDWKKNGETAGAFDKSGGMSAIQICYVNKNELNKLLKSIAK